MEHQESNVGGQVAGMAQSVSGQSFAEQPALPNMPAANPISSPNPHGSSQPESVSSGSPNQPAPAMHINNNDASNTTSSIVAEDSDLIEKEWVEKAKAIVEKTRKDPFHQSLELNQLKADYLQKRYGKNIGSDGQQ